MLEFRRWKLGLLAVILSACASNPQPQQPQPPEIPPEPARVVVQFKLTIPLPPSQELTPSYVSPATRSVRVTTNGNPETINVGAGEASCSGTAPVTCTVMLERRMAPGDHSFKVEAFSEPAAAGDLLAVFGPETRTLTAGTLNTLRLTLTGVSNRVLVQPETSDPLDNPAAATYALAVSGTRSFRVIQYDAANNVISGPGTPKLHACVSGTDLVLSNTDEYGNFRVTTQNSHLFGAKVTLRRENCTGPVVTEVALANTVAVRLTTSGLPDDKTAEVKAFDANGNPLTVLNAPGTYGYPAGSYRFEPQRVADGDYAYRPDVGSVAVDLRLGEPYTLPITYARVRFFRLNLSSNQPFITPGGTVNITAQLVNAEGEPAALPDIDVSVKSPGATIRPAIAKTNAQGAAVVELTASSGGTEQYVVTATATVDDPVESNTLILPVRVAPVARDDAPDANSVPGQPYHAAFDAAHVLEAPGLLANDDRGSPAATLVSFGGGSLTGSEVTSYLAGVAVSPLPGHSGGTLKVHADGRVEFTPPSGFTGLFSFSYRLSNSVGSDDATVTFAVGERPQAVADTYSPVIPGNMSISTYGPGRSGFTVLANDRGSALTVSLVPDSVPAGATVVLNANGSLGVEPPAGYSGPLSFSYTIENGFGKQTAAVNLNVGPRVWFLKEGAAGGNGSQSKPFGTLGEFAAVNSDSSKEGEVIFVQGGQYTGSLTLLAGQRLIGQGAQASFAEATGLTNPDITPPDTRQAKPLLSANLTVGQNNTVRGLTLGGSDSLTGTNFGTLKLQDVTISSSGRALNLNGGTLEGGLDALFSTSGAQNVYLNNVETVDTFNLGATGGLTGTTGTALEINGGSGRFSFGGAIGAAPGLRTIRIAGKSGGSVLLTGELNPGSGTSGRLEILNNADSTFTFSSNSKRFETSNVPAVTVTNNPRSNVVFSGSRLRITGMGAGGLGLVASGGGTLVVEGAGNVISTSGAVALSVNGTEIGTRGLTFQAISSSGGSNGIYLKNTGSGGGLTVTGEGSAGSGGVIRDMTGSDGAEEGNGIYLNNTGNVKLRWMRLTNAHNHGIRGVNVTHFELRDSTVDGVNGTNENGNVAEGSVSFDNLKGSATIANSTIEGGHLNNVRVVNSDGVLNRLTFDAVTVRNTGSFGAHNIFVQARGTATLNVTVQNSNLSAARDNLFHFNANGNIVSDIQLLNNTLDGGGTTLSGSGAVRITSGGNNGDVPKVTYQLQGNTINNSFGTAVLISKLLDSGQFTGRVTGNTINGSQQGSGLEMLTVGQGSHTVQVENNTIRNFALYGVLVQGGGAFSPGLQPNAEINATITNNSAQAAGTAVAALHVNGGTSSNSGSGTPDAYQLCINARNNTFVAPNASDSIRAMALRQRFATTIRLPGYAGGNADTAAVESLLRANNPQTSGPIWLTHTVGGGGNGFVSGDCKLP
ncbi:hypothetical protein HNR42_003451 [Deinobacterium chartae]|uniref:Big-1 domain-containing protein n=1 Tax=Deinobacterium chartae TaxID=521158 RepID=A0A841I6E4_9DEIO|nr:Ig-like domain-containing protein [Deinobacterium chartae]MBB6099990.1 hypothetical protein [Deinobacterium chartae]